MSPVDARCDEIRQTAASLTQSLQMALRTQLTSLPKKVRSMSLREFVGRFGGSVDAVMGAEARQAQSDFNTWVAQTPLPATVSGARRPFFF